MLLAVALAAPVAEGAPVRKLDDSLRLRSGGGTVAVDVYVEGDVAAAARELRALGMRVSAVSRRAPQRMVEGRLPVAALDAAAALGRTSAIVAVAGTGTNAGAATSQGDAAHRGPEARGLGPDGRGVVLGVISDSIDNLPGGIAASQASGDLPADVRVLDDGDGTGRDEGRAMAEIVYDTAPAIGRVLFHTGTAGPADKAQGIDELVAAGADVIVDDTFVLTEPFFQDGVVSQAVDRAKAAGVTYVVSAGNRARQSWEGEYAGTTDHDFDPSGALDSVQRLGVSSDFFMELQWDEPWGEAQTDLALDVYDLDAGTLLATADDDNLVSGLPAEFVEAEVPAGHDVGIGIRRVAGTRAPFMKYIVGGVPTFAIAEHAVPGAGAIDPDAASALGALTIAAVPHAGNATPEAFSSRGPAFRLFDDAGNRLAGAEVRQKPDLAGADGVATTVPGFRAFRGTSAAAPSVAGVAALIGSVDPRLTPDDISAALRSTGGTVDCTSAPGLPDLDCGFGFPLADVQVQKLDSSPPAVEPVLSPAAPTGRGGFYTGALTASWNVGDTASPIYASTGCGPAAMETDGASTLTCTARSLGGTTTRSVTVNRDSSPPTRPVITGIGPRRYAPSRLPRAACRAADPTSGIAACRVTGRSTRKGSHRLTATAVNGAGLASSSRRTYRVVSPRVTKLARRGRTLRYTLDTATGVRITVRRCADRCRTVRKLTQNGRRGNNRKTLPKLARGRYRVTLRPAGGKPRTLRLTRP
jgi:subtilisin family serine protease